MMNIKHTVVLFKYMKYITHYTLYISHTHLDFFHSKRVIIYMKTNMWNCDMNNKTDSATSRS